jgi:ABC-type antimicrobial peptide transport system permease subunit
MEKEGEENKELIARTPPPVGRVLGEEFPEIEKCTRYLFHNLEFDVENQSFNEDGAFVDEDIFSMFDFKLIKGDTSNVLSSNLNIVISKKLANKIFNTDDVVGKSLKVDAETVFTISGVFEDIPLNSHLKFEFVCNYEALHEFGFPRELWNNYNNNNYTYVLLNQNADFKTVNTKIEDVILKNANSLKAGLFLQPFKDVYLKSNFNGDFENLGNIKNVYIFLIISVLILIIAGFNFMNLTTAQATKRLKEIGVRKVLGAQRNSLIKQFLGEALIMTFIAHFFAIIFIELAISKFNLLTNKDLAIDYFNIDFYLLIGTVVLIIGLFSGSYPSLYLSRLNALTIFKEGKSGSSKGNYLRRVFVITQFVISISLIIVSLTIWTQLNFLNNKDLGFNKSNLIYFPLPDQGNKYEVLKERLLEYSGVENVTVLSHELTDVVHLAQATWEGKDKSDKTLMNMIWADEDFISTMKMEIIKGSDFKMKHQEDTNALFILNEAAVNMLGFDNPIGKRFNIGRWNGYINGVVKDFNFQPLYEDVKPMVLSNLNYERFYLYVRINGTQIEKILPIIKDEFKKFAPEVPFDYNFLDNEIKDMYKNENRLAELTKDFTLITILISCLGLFGLIFFMTERRTKEIGIRKTLGASISNIVYLLSKEIIVWIIIANMISWPIAYYFINKWLSNFSYRIELNMLPFILSGLIVFVIALLTLNIKAVKAAYANPVHALRYE